MTDARTIALRNLVAAFGGNPPNWIKTEYDAACAVLNTPDPVRDAAPGMLAAAAHVLDYVTLDRILSDQSRHENEVFGIRIGDLRALAIAVAKAEAR